MLVPLTAAALALGGCGDQSPVATPNPAAAPTTEVELLAKLTEALHDRSVDAIASLLHAEFKATTPVSPDGVESIDRTEFLRTLRQTFEDPDLMIVRFDLELR